MQKEMDASTFAHDEAARALICYEIAAANSLITLNQKHQSVLEQSQLSTKFKSVNNEDHINNQNELKRREKERADAAMWARKSMRDLTSVCGGGEKEAEETAVRWLKCNGINKETAEIMLAALRNMPEVEEVEEELEGVDKQASKNVEGQPGSTQGSIS